LVFRFGLGATGLHNSLAIYWVWADQFTAELARGVVYPRWMPASDAGLGTPVFYFYPPLAFYLTAGFAGLGLSTAASLTAVFGAAFALSGIGCWHWLKDRSEHPLLGGAFFMAAPYHLFNYSERGALAESVAIALIPFLAIGLRRIADRRGGVALTALVYAGMIATHLPLALLVSLFLIAPYALIHRDRLRDFVPAAACGIGLAAIYLLPALALAKFHDAAQLYRLPSFRTDYWSILNPHWGDVTFTVMFLIAGAIIAAAAIPALRRERWAVYAVAVVVAVSGIIPFIWSMPLLRDVQFPYRALPVAEFALATALARVPRKRAIALIPFALPLLVSAMVLPGFYSRMTEDVERLSAVHADVYEYLPKGVMKPGHTSARLNEILRSRIPPPHVAGNVVEQHFYFPAWSCGTAEPQTQLLMHEPSCSPRIVWTWAEKLGAAISLLTALALVAMSVALAKGPLAFRRKLLASLAAAG
jgi:uncharacterized membrane protein